MCPSTSWQRHAKQRQETRLIENVMAFHVTIAEHQHTAYLMGLSHTWLCRDGRPAWFCPSKSICGRKDIYPLARGTIINAQPKKRAAICAWEECGGIEANGIAIVIRLCFLPGWPITAFFVTHARWCSYRAIFALKSTFGAMAIWKNEKYFVSLCNTRWQSHRPTHSTFIYRIEMMLLTVLRFFVFIPTPNPGWSRPEHYEDESLKRTADANR